MRKYCKVCNARIRKTRWLISTRKMISESYGKETELICDTCCDYAIDRVSRKAIRELTK